MHHDDGPIRGHFCNGPKPTTIWYFVAWIPSPFGSSETCGSSFLELKLHLICRRTRVDFFHLSRAMSQLKLLSGHVLSRHKIKIAVSLRAACDLEDIFLRRYLSDIKPSSRFFGIGRLRIGGRREREGTASLASASPSRCEHAARSATCWPRPRGLSRCGACLPFELSPSIEAQIYLFMSKIS